MFTFHQSTWPCTLAWAASVSLCCTASNMRRRPSTSNMTTSSSKSKAPAPKNKTSCATTLELTNSIQLWDFDWKQEKGVSSNIHATERISLEEFRIQGIFANQICDNCKSHHLHLQHTDLDQTTMFEPVIQLRCQSLGLQPSPYKRTQSKGITNNWQNMIINFLNRQQQNMIQKCKKKPKGLTALWNCIYTHKDRITQTPFENQHCNNFTCSSVICM